MLKKLCHVLKSIMVIFIQILRKLPSTSSQVTVTLLFFTYHILNCNVWPNVSDDSDTATQYSLQLAVLITVFNWYKDIDVMKCYTEDYVLSSFLAVLYYAHQYFNISNIDPIKFWNKILSLAEEHIFWKPTTLLKYVYVHHFLMHHWKDFSVKLISSKQLFVTVWQR